MKSSLRLHLTSWLGLPSSESLIGAGGLPRWLAHMPVCSLLAAGMEPLSVTWYMSITIRLIDYLCVMESDFSKSKRELGGCCNAFYGLILVILHRHFAIFYLLTMSHQFQPTCNMRRISHLSHLISDSQCSLEGKSIERFV